MTTKIELLDQIVTSKLDEFVQGVRAEASNRLGLDRESLPDALADLLKSKGTSRYLRRIGSHYALVLAFVTGGVEWPDANEVVFTDSPDDEDES